MNNSIEIEQRFITHQQHILNSWLEKQATWLSHDYYYDVYFQNPDKPFVIADHKGVKDANEWLRLRICNGSSILCYKHWHRNHQDKLPLYADQLEIRVENFEIMRQILQRLGYQPIAEFCRWRTSWKYDMYTIVEDKVDDLGIFYEIEYIGSNSDPYVVIKSIHQLLRFIGITDFKIIDKGYPWMYWNSNWKEELGIE